MAEYEHTPSPTSGRAVYGFALLLLSHTLFFIYLIWAFVPTKILEDNFGLFYLPDKYFTLYLPVLILCGITIFAFCIYPSFNLIMTPNIDNISTIRDKYTIYRCKFVNYDGKQCENKIDFNPETGWDIPKYCAVHETSFTAQGNGKIKEEQISNMCDCPKDYVCMLRGNPNHLDPLKRRIKVPCISDLDLSEICREIFGDVGKSN